MRSNSAGSDGSGGDIPAILGIFPMMTGAENGVRLVMACPPSACHSRWKLRAGQGLHASMTTWLTPTVIPKPRTSRGLALSPARHSVPARTIPSRKRGTRSNRTANCSSESTRCIASGRADGGGFCGGCAVGVEVDLAPAPFRATSVSHDPLAVCLIRAPPGRWDKPQSRHRRLRATRRVAATR